VEERIEIVIDDDATAETADNIGSSNGGGLDGPA
jgi:hypothetical protein